MSSAISQLVEKFTSPKSADTPNDSDNKSTTINKTDTPTKTSTTEASTVKNNAPSALTDLKSLVAAVTAPVTDEKKSADSTAADTTETARTTSDEKTILKEDRRNEPVDPDNADAAVKRNVTGVVSFFSIASGYGFIKRNDTGGDVFVHITDILQRSPRETHVLSPEDECEFAVVANYKGPKAIAVTAIGGQWLQGSRVLTGRPRRPRTQRNANKQQSQDAAVKPEGANSTVPADRPRSERRPLRARRSPKKDVSAESVHDDEQQPAKQPQDKEKKDRRPRRQSNKKPRNKSVSGEGDAKAANAPAADADADDVKSTVADNTAIKTETAIQSVV